MLIAAGTRVNVNIEVVGAAAELCHRVNGVVCGLVASPVRFGEGAVMTPHVTLVRGRVDVDVEAEDLAARAAALVGDLRGTEIELGAPFLEDRDDQYIFLKATPVAPLRQAQRAVRRALRAAGLMTEGGSGSKPHATAGFLPDDALDRAAEVVAALAPFATPARCPVTHVRVSEDGDQGTCRATLATVAL